MTSPFFRACVVGIPLLLSAVREVRADYAATNQVTTQARAIVLRNLAGEYVFVSDLCYPGEEKPNKPRTAVVLSFMASDCGPCKEELPVFLKIAREMNGKGVRFFLVSTDPFSKREALDKVVKDFGVDCDMLLDPYRLAYTKFGAQAIPRTYVLAPDGTVAACIQWSPTEYEAVLRVAVQKAQTPAQ